jgi:Tol biopolymer transport system component
MFSKTRMLYKYTVLFFRFLKMAGRMNTNRILKFFLIFIAVEMMLSGCAFKPKYLNSELPFTIDISEFVDLTSPNIGKLIFVKNIKEIPQLFIANPDGSQEFQLTYLKDGVDSPTASPDGNYVAFLSPGSNQYHSVDLFVIKTNGSGLTNLTNGQIYAFYFKTLTWSPDSKEIVFTSRNNTGEMEFQCVNIMTKNVRKLLGNIGLIETHPTWSPSGTLIAFVYAPSRARSQTRDVYLINSDGTNLHKLTPSKANRNRGDFYPSWSPNGQRIAFTNGYTGDLYIVKADGSNLQKYESQSCLRGYLDPRWSPDSRHIAVLCQKDNVTSVEIIDSLNLEQPSINFGQATDFAFSPNGKYIWFNNPVTGGFIANTDGKNQAAILNSAEKIAWIPNSIANSTIAPIEQRAANAACGNSYWPIVVGAKWTYRYDEVDGDTFTASEEITDYEALDDSRAELLINGYKVTCWSGGNITPQDNTWSFFLPSEEKIFDGGQSRYSTDRPRYIISGPESFEVNGSLVDAYKICNYYYQDYCTFWSKGIGKVAETFGGNWKTLIDYYIPAEETTANPAIITPAEQTQTAQKPSSSEYCNNPYWPILQDAWWKYYLPGDTSTEPNHTWIDTVNSISRNGDNTTFNISSAEVGSSANQTRAYSCDKTGWIFDGSGNAILPPESLLTEGFQWSLSDGTVMSVHFMHLLESRTGLGILDLLQITRVGQMYWDLYVYGVGPYGFGTGASSADLTEYYLPEVNRSNPPSANIEAQIRYILADAMFNGIDYYRSHNDTDATAEAIRRWDACVRVSNVDQFERKEIAVQGWLVTYKGTEQPIDGMDVTLTAEGCSTANSLCSNTFFPVVEGAKWTYYQTTSTGEQIETGPATYTVENVKENEYRGLDFIWMLSYGGVDYNQKELSCDGGVIHAGDVIWTPNNSDMVAGKQVPWGDTYLTIFPLTSINTRMGQFDAVPICENGVDPVISNSCRFFVENIGLVQVTEKGVPKFDIISYSFP